MEKENTTHQKKGEVKISMNTNTIAALSYVLGLISGAIVYLVSKDNFARFHGMQSMLLALSFSVIRLAIMLTPFFDNVFMSVLNLLYLILSIVLIIKAYKGERYHLPLLGDLAEKFSKAK